MSDRRRKKQERGAAARAYLQLGGDGVLVHVDVVLVDGGLDELVALGLHPRGDEGRQVQPRVPVQHQLVVDDLVRRLLGDRLLRHPEPGQGGADVAGRERRVDGLIGAADTV